MSGYVVGFLPVALVILLSVIAPTFMAPMLQKPPELFGLPARPVHPRRRLLHDVDRLHPDSPHRRHRGLSRVGNRRCGVAGARRSACLLLTRRDPADGSGPGAPVAAGLDAGADARGNRASAASLRTDAAADGARLSASRRASPALRRSVAPRNACSWPAIRATCAQSTSWA